MSGISMTSAAAGAVTTLKPNDPLADVLPAPFTSTREFSSNDEIVLFAEVYDNRQAGRNGATDPVELTPAIKGLEPGPYVLLVEVHSEGADGPKATRGGPISSSPSAGSVRSRRSRPYRDEAAGDVFAPTSHWVV